MKRLTILAALLLAAACQSREELPDAVVFGIEEEAPLTRSLLTATGIESKKTGITLAAYRDGTLAEAAHFTSSLGAMPLRLERNRAYKVYALVNMGDQTASLPVSEDGLSAFTYTLSGYSAVNRLGMPMAGSLSCTAGSGSTAIPVQRLLAKVEVDLSVEIPGASIGRVRVFNLNRSLKPFGVSAIGSAEDVLEAQELATGNGPSENKSASEGGASGHFVLYVPENRQGNLSGIASSREKNPDLHAGVEERLGQLSYLETDVAFTGRLEGSVTYRSCLGNNATSNFDIERNKHYLWQIRYLENGLQIDDWKCDTDQLEDKRSLSWRGGEAETVEGIPARVFSVFQGRNVLAGVDYGYTSQGVFLPLTGLAGTDWTWTASPAAGITSSAGVEDGKDVISYSAGSTAEAGYYPVRVQRTFGGRGDDAFLHVLPATERSFRYFISTGNNASAEPVTSYVIPSGRNTEHTFYLIEHQVTKEYGTVVEDVFTRVVPFSESNWYFDPSVSRNIGEHSGSGAITHYDYDDLLSICGLNERMRAKPALYDTKIPRKRQHGWSRILVSPTAHPEIRCALDIRVDGYGFRYAMVPESADILVDETVQLTLLQWKDQYQGDVLTATDTGEGTDVTLLANYARWSTSNSNRVSVSAHGLCTGVTSGAATVTCQNNSSVNGDYDVSFTFSSVITVGEGGAKSYALVLSPESGRLKAGHTAVLTATLICYTDGVETSRIDHPGGVVWSSGNPSVVSVDGNGTVTGLIPGGPITITAVWTQGSYSATATASVEVLPHSGFGIDTGWEDDGSEINL